MGEKGVCGKGGGSGREGLEAGKVECEEVSGRAAVWGGANGWECVCHSDRWSGKFGDVIGGGDSERVHIKQLKSMQMGLESRAEDQQQGLGSSYHG